MSKYPFFAALKPRGTEKIVSSSKPELSPRGAAAYSTFTSQADAVTVGEVRNLSSAAPDETSRKLFTSSFEEGSKELRDLCSELSNRNCSKFVFDFAARLSRLGCEEIKQFSDDQKLLKNPDSIDDDGARSGFFDSIASVSSWVYSKGPGCNVVCHEASQDIARIFVCGIDVGRPTVSPSGSVVAFTHS